MVDSALFALPTAYVEALTSCNHSASTHIFLMVTATRKAFFLSLVSLFKRWEGIKKSIKKIENRERNFISLEFALDVVFMLSPSSCS